MGQMIYKQDEQL